MRFSHILCALAASATALGVAASSKAQDTFTPLYNLDYQPASPMPSDNITLHITSSNVYVALGWQIVPSYEQIDSSISLHFDYTPPPAGAFDDLPLILFDTSLTIPPLAAGTYEVDISQAFITPEVPVPASSPLTVVPEPATLKLAALALISIIIIGRMR